MVSTFPISATSIHPSLTYTPSDHARILRQIQLSTALPPGAKPHAIFLSVFLSKASFLPTVVQHPKKTIYHDIKIDVYFNGELCASTFVSDRYHGDSYRMTEQIIRFSGRRVHRQLEKPWVLVPPGQSPDGRPRPDKQNIGLPGDAKGQWASVSKALMMEADKLGRGRNGELSVLGDYLSTLADLEMPAEVGGMQKAGGPKMGIIDVVVTAGKGHKDDANALRLMEPTPIRLEGLATAEAKISPPHPTPDEIFTTPITNQQSLSLRAKAETLAQGFTSQPQNQRGSQSRLESDPMSSGNQTTLFSRERAQSFGVRQLNDLNATGMHGGSSNTKISSDTPVPVTPSFNNLMHPPRPKRKLQSPSMNPSSDSAPSNQPAERKPRFKWEIVLDNKLTLEEEMKGIATRAAKTPNHDSGIDADNPAQERRLRLRPRDKKDNPLPPGLDVPQGPTSSSPYTLPHHHHHQSSSTPKSTPKINTITPQPPEPASDSFTPDSSASRRHRPGPPTPLSLGGWQGTPPLSNDAVVTYAAGDVLRQVKGERNGWFKEAGVVMGARFLVG